VAAKAAARTINEIREEVKARLAGKAPARSSRDLADVVKLATDLRKLTPEQQREYLAINAEPVWDDNPDEFTLEITDPTVRDAALMALNIATPPRCVY
jgi:ATP phosphoribosyltransferase